MKKREQGILTVEASIVLTLMLLFILFLFSFSRVYRAQNLVSHASLQSADAVAMESFLRETALQSDAEDVAYLASYITDSSAVSTDSFESLRSANLPKIVREKFIAAIASTEAKADEKLRNMGIKNGLSGIDFSECKMDLVNDDVIVAITCTIEMQFPVFGFNEITVTKAAKAKTFGEILFEVSTQPNNPGWGSTSGDNKVAHGSTVEIVATPNYGYKFVGWSDGVTDNPRKVTVTDAQQYVAIFEKDQFGINLGTRITCNTTYAGITHSGYGTVTGAGNYAYLDSATISATPSANYVFAGWDDNGDGVVDNTNQTRTISIDKTYSFKAIFKPETYDITVTTNNSAYGTAQVSQGTNKGSTIQAEYGSKVQLIATAKDTVKYIFSKWSNNSTQASTTVTVVGKATYEAKFVENTYTVTFYNGNTVVHTTNVICGSSINGSKTVITSSMPSNPSKNGATFDKWTYNGSAFTASTAVKGNISVYAAWCHTVTLNANGGSISGAGSKNYTVSAGGSFDFSGYTPTRNGYTFNGWYNGNTKYTGSKTINSNVTLTASWTCTHKTVAGSEGSKLTKYSYKADKNTQGGNSEKDSCKKYGIYTCQRCGYVSESVLANTGSNHADVWAACDTRHYCTPKSGVCRSVSTGQQIVHNWTSKYCIRCEFCGRRQNKILLNGEWRYIYWCGDHGRVETRPRVPCPGIDAAGG